MVIIYQKNKSGTELHSDSVTDINKKIIFRNNINNQKTEGNVLSVKKLKTSKKIYKNEILSDIFATFLSEYEAKLKEFHSESDQKISINDVLSGLARIYEKVRTAVEYKGENVIRRNAIERILKRLIWENKNFRPASNYQNISESLLRELIWAKYLPNNEIPESKITTIQKIIEKYIYIIERLENYPEGKNPGKIKSWIVGIASSEIEDSVDPSNRELFINFMKDWFFNNYVWSDDNISYDEKDLQIYIAIHKSFTKSDDPIIRYHLLKKIINNWDSVTDEGLSDFINHFPDYYENIENHLTFPQKLKIYRKIASISPAFEILKQLINLHIKNLKTFSQSKENIENDIINICNNNYKLINNRVKTGIMRSIIYIFITKVFFAILIEVPYEIIRYGEMRYIPLTINIVFPPLIMFLIGLSIKTPEDANTKILYEKISRVIYKNENQSKTYFTVSQKTKSKFYYVFSFLYSTFFVAAFYSITKLLLFLNFTMLGVIIFFLFLSLILLFAFRIKYQANYLKVEREKENLFSHLFSYLTLPFVNLGFYLSRGLSQINFFTVLLDFLIEAPFKNSIELIEDWLFYMRERRKEVIEIPE